MASAFAHIAVPVIIYATTKKSVNLYLFFLAAFVSVLPDADVIAFKLGIPYESQWGHRGFSHSVFFAFCIAGVIGLFHKKIKVSFSAAFWVCFLSCISHAFLDSMTNGGLGVALYWPFSNERVFFPFRPIQVSPIGIVDFFNGHGLKIIISEIKWVFLPSLIFILLSTLIRRMYAKKP